MPLSGDNFFMVDLIFYYILTHIIKLLKNHMRIYTMIDIVYGYLLDTDHYLYEISNY